MIYERLVFEVVNSPAFQAYLEKAVNAAQNPDNDTPKDPTLGCFVMMGVVGVAVIFALTRKNKLPKENLSNNDESYVPSRQKRESSDYRFVPTNEGLGLIKNTIGVAWNIYDAYLQRNATTAIHNEREARLEKAQTRRNLQVAIEQEFAALIAGQKPPKYHTEHHVEWGEQYDIQTRRAALKAKNRVLQEVLEQFDNSPLLPIYGYKSSEAFDKGLSLLHQLSNMPRHERKKRQDDESNIIDADSY